MIKKASLILLIGLVTTGCSSLHSTMESKRFEWLTTESPHYGDTHGDVCISCGENFTFIPNEVLGAQAQAKREGFDWNDTSPDAVVLHY